MGAVGDANAQRLVLDLRAAGVAGDAIARGPVLDQRAAGVAGDAIARGPVLDLRAAGVAGDAIAQRAALDLRVRAEFGSNAATVPVPPLDLERAATGRLLLGGVAGWALGLIGGAALGYAMEPDAGDSHVGAAEWWIGAWLGSSLGAATGVHLANHQRGNVIANSIGAVLIVPIAAAAAAPLIGTDALVAIPFLQIGTSIVLERRGEQGGH